MQARRQEFLGLGPHGFHRLSYLEWGDPESDHLVICVHGLTRNAHDFDYLARALAPRARVVCLDVAGRGDSQWLSHPADYNYPQYLADANSLLARVTAPVPRGLLARLLGRPGAGPKVVDWVGTSMGGLIGMMLAAQEGCPIRRMVMNDVGPLIPAAALRRIGEYVGRAPEFASLAEAEAFLRRVCAPFGPLTDEHWGHLARHSTEPGTAGLRLRYDPAIGLPFRSGGFSDVALWELWDKVRCPTLVIRGAESDLLAAETVARMGQTGPRASAVELAGIGHAPVLMDPEQIRVVADFLLAS